MMSFWLPEVSGTTGHLPVPIKPRDGARDQRQAFATRQRLEFRSPKTPVNVGSWPPVIPASEGGDLWPEEQAGYQEEDWHVLGLIERLGLKDMMGE